MKISQAKTSLDLWTENVVEIQALFVSRTVYTFHDSVVAVDISDSAPSYAKRNNPKRNCKRADAQVLPFKKRILTVSLPWKLLNTLAAAFILLLRW